MRFGNHKLISGTNVTINKATTNINKKGKTPFVNLSTDTSDMDDTAYRHVPTGGVIVPIMELIEIIIPK